MDDFKLRNVEIFIFKELNIKYLPDECLKLVDNYLSYTFQDSNELKKAVLLWKNDKKKANVNYGPIGSWNVSKVSDFSELFVCMKTFNENISSWDVSNGENMEFMFYGCDTFNQDLSSWDVSNVKNMNQTFTGCKSFNSNISNWNTRNIKSMMHTFYGCDTFNQDLNSWNNHHCDKKDMFHGCILLNI